MTDQQKYDRLLQINTTLRSLLSSHNIPHDIAAQGDMLVGELPVDVPEGLVDQKVKTMLIQEIYDTERDYVSDLDIIINVFHEPLKGLGIISEDEQYTLFSNIEELYVLNRDKVLARLDFLFDEAEENGVLICDLDLGDVFLELAEHLKFYTDYCANQPSALNLLESLSIENNQFDKFVNDIMDNNPVVRRLSLLSFIIKPVQRLCKYPLLLRELIKLTAPNSEEYNKINLASEKVGVTVGFVNDMQRAAEEKRQQELLEIQSIEDRIEGAEFLGLALDKNRKMITQGSSHRVIKKKIEPRYLWLFNNILVVAKPLKKPKRGKKNKQDYEYKFDFSIHVKNLSITDTSDTDYAQNLFILKDRSDDHFEAVTVANDDLESKNTWLKQLRNIFRVYQKQELQKHKADIDQGKTRSLALSVKAVSTTVALRKKIKKRTLSVVSKDGSLVEDDIVSSYSAATPIISYDFLQRSYKEIMTGPAYVPVLTKPKAWNEWLYYQTESGKPYYYNKETRSVTWTKPENSVFA